jgi:hypothetical protein
MTDPTVQLHAVAEADGTYHVIFSRVVLGDVTGYAVDILDGRISSVDFGCGQTPDRLIEAVAGAIIVATPAPRSTPSSEGPTGVPAVDSILAALEAGDAQALIDLMVFRTAPCRAEPPPLSAEPRCPEGEEDGSPVDSFAYAECEGVSLTPDEGADSVRSQPLDSSAVYGVYATPLDSTYGRALFQSQYAIVMERDDGQAWVLLAHEDGLIGLDSGCAQTPAALVESAGLAGTRLTP